MSATNFPEFNAAVTELTTKVSTLLGDVATMQSVANVQVAVDKAAEASTSATEAAASEAAAASSAVQAAASETASETARTVAESAQSAAAASETAAAGSASTASTKASEASTSAANAAASETAAAGSASTASTKASEASTSAANAAASETAAHAAKIGAEAARDRAETAAATVTGNLIEMGGVSLASGVYPAKPANNGAFWKVTTGGTVDGVEYGVGDTLIYSKNLDQFYKIDNTESVTSVAGKTGVVTLTKADVGLDNVDNTSDASKPISTATQTALDAKAPLASPALTGTPTAPTPAAGTNTTQIANTAFVQAALAALVDSSPTALDTLNELAAALGDDPNFATTMTNALALKAPLASPALTGNPTAPTPAADDSGTSISTTAHVKAAMALFGVGGAKSLEFVNLDSVHVSGFYSVDQCPGGPNGGQGNGMLLVTGSGYVSQQTYHPYGTSTTYARSRVGTTWSAWSELWHTGNLVKQSSPTDTTAGALMAVGAGGWMGRASNNDSYIAGYPQDIGENISQIYRRSVGDMGVPGYSASLHFAAVDTWGRVRISHYTPRAWIQGGTASTGTGWTAELYHTGNILGTVSQSAGVPTGAIIERGSNANGEYVRFADGTQICLKKIPANVAISTAGSSLYWTGEPIPGGQFAASFTEEPSVTMFVTGNFPSMLQGGEGLTATAFGIFYQYSDAMRPLSSYIYHLRAEGRWY